MRNHWIIYWKNKLSRNFHLETLSMSQEMKAIGLSHYLPVSDENCLTDISSPLPKPGPRDLLVRIEAISVNPVDTKVRAPKAQLEDPPRILGWDACGTVVSCGEDVTLFGPGQRVFYAGDITRAGCNSEYHLVDERIAGHAPASLNAEEAAALPLTSLTAWEALFERLAIPLDASHAETEHSPSLLIIGAAGGVGSIAIQLARQLAGLKVIATASRPESSDWCKEMGADKVLNHQQNLVEQFQQANLAKPDYILCCQPADAYFDTMVELIKPQGGICGIVDNQQPIALQKLKPKSATFSWEFMFTRAMFQTEDMIEQHHILNEVSRLLDEGILKGTLKETLSPINAAHLRSAHQRLEAGNMIGKLVLSGWA
jgi:zinc-binding alcohol dehydrogenase family protein